MGTMGKKTLGTVFALLLCSSLLLSQSLVEVAKKEKERRAKLKGKSGKVVTNDDLHQIKKKPNVVSNEDLKKGRRQPGVSVLPAKLPEEDKKASVETQETKPVPALLDSPEQTKDDENKLLENLELKYEEAKTQVQMLLTKMNGLFMKYYSPGDTTPKERVQSEISQTALQLQKARNDEEKAKRELEDYKLKKQK